MKPASDDDLFGSDDTTHNANLNDKFKIVGDVIDHMAKVLEISKWIKIPNVDLNQIRLHVFLNSLDGDAKERWNNKIDGIVTTWNELECNDKGSISDIESSDNEYDKPCDKNHKNSCSDSFFKPYLDAQEGNGIYNFEESNEYYPQIHVPTEYDISNPDELCKSKEFRVIRYSMGSDKNTLPSVQANMTLGKKPMGPCLASTTTSSTKGITGGS
ncbi:hypothetical protein Tco_0217536 [Tanacetum coccineum]